MLSLSNLVTEEDLDALFSLESECIEGGWTKQMIIDAYKDSSYHFIKASFEERIIGYINYRIIIDEMEINSVAVLPPFRGRGIAKSLLKEALSDAKNTNGAKTAFLEVNENNIVAIKLYESVGFTTISRRNNYYLDQTALVLKRDLD